MATDVTRRDLGLGVASGEQLRAASPAVPALTATEAVAVTTGFWASLLASALTLVFVVLTIVSNAVVVGATDAETGAFLIVQLVPVLLLVPVVVVLLACIHTLTAEPRRIFSLVALVFSSLYGAIIGVNYVIQLVTARPLILAGEGEALGLVAMASPGSVFVALEAAGYGFFALMALFVAAVFAGGGTERWLRRLFGASGVTGVVGATAAIADLPIVMMSGFGLSLLAFLVAVVVLGIHLGRLGAQDARLRRR